MVDMYLEYGDDSNTNELKLYDFSHINTERLTLDGYKIDILDLSCSSMNELVIRNSIINKMIVDRLSVYNILYVENSHVHEVDGKLHEYPTTAYIDKSTFLPQYFIKNLDDNRETIVVRDIID